MTTTNADRSGNGLLAVFPHPDDESFTCAGLFAALRERNVPVTLISTTRGEAGEIVIPGLATAETIGAVREAELRTAMRAVGVDDIRFLGYRDSGMAGTPENDDPRAFVRAPEPLVVDQLRRLIRETRPAIVVTFGPDGIYGHPDHIRAYQTTTAATLAEGTAAEGWRVDALYYATAPRERFLELAKLPNAPFHDASPEELAKLGTPLAEITNVLDISPWIEPKRAALAAHRTQFGDNGPLAEMPRADYDRWIGREHFLRAPLPWSAGADDEALTRYSLRLVQPALAW